MLKSFLLILILVAPAEHPSQYIKYVESLSEYRTKQECMEEAKKASMSFQELLKKENYKFNGYASYGCLEINTQRSY